MSIKFSNYKDINITGRLRVCVELAKKVNIKNKIVLDVGCSNGLMAYLLSFEKPKKYIGIDPSKKAITYAKKNIKKASFYQSNADKLPVKNSSVDTALLFDVIEHVPMNTEKKVFKEVARILKRKGKLVLSTPNSNFITNVLDPAWYFGHRHYNPKIIKLYLEESGFSVELQEVRGGIWFSIYLILLYISKWIFKNPNFKNDTIMRKDDIQFSKPGIHTIYIIATKK